MAVDEKDETVNEENSNSESETETGTEKLESGGDVVTSPTDETSNSDDKYVQLEQRFNGQEQQQQQQQTQQPPSQQEQPQDDNSSNEESDNSDDSDGMESNDEIKKILGL